MGHVVLFAIRTVY